MRMRRLRWRNRGRGSWKVVDSGWFVLKLGFRSSLFICRNYGSCPPWRRSVEVSRCVVAPQGRRSQGGRTGTYRVPGLVTNKVNYFDCTVFLLFFRALVSLQFRKLSNVWGKADSPWRAPYRISHITYIFVAVFGQVKAVCWDGFSDHCIFVSPYYYNKRGGF